MAIYQHYLKNDGGDLKSEIGSIDQEGGGGGFVGSKFLEGDLL